jgi:hypothetical protein
MLDRVPVGRLIEAAFQIGEGEIGGAQFATDPGERYARVVDIHQIHIADEDQRGHGNFLLLRAQRSDPAEIAARARVSQ